MSAVSENAGPVPGLLIPEPPYTIIPGVPEMLSGAKHCAAAFIQAEGVLREAVPNVLWRFWNLGQSLTALKAQVGHGRWMFYCAANFPELGGDEKSRVNRAGEAMGFFAANPNSPELGNFTNESVRKFFHRLAPDKERPLLEGDRPLSPPTHHFTFVSAITRWNQQLGTGLIPAPEVEALRAEVVPALLILKQRLGAPFIREILDSEK